MRKKQKMTGSYSGMLKDGVVPKNPGYSFDDVLSYGGPINATWADMSKGAVGVKSKLPGDCLKGC